MTSSFIQDVCKTQQSSVSSVSYYITAKESFDRLHYQYTLPKAQGPPSPVPGK